jgi:hypothetical protein
MNDTPQNDENTSSQILPTPAPRSLWDKLFNAHKRTTLIIFVAVFAAIGVTTLVISRAATAAGPIKGIAGKCLDNKNGKLKTGNPIQLYSCNSSSGQQWTVMSDGTIRASERFCLDVKYAGTTSRTPVWLYDCNGTVAQQWKVNTDGSIVNPHSKLCLDDKSAKTNNGNPIWMYTCNGTAAQKWTVPKTTTPPKPTPTPKPAPTPTPPPTPTPKPTPTPTPAPTPTPGTAKPSAANTGVPAGTTLAVVTGDQTYSASANGQTITGKDFHGFVKVTGANITFKNCIFRGRAISSNNALLDTEKSTGTITVQNSEFAPSNPSAGIDGLWTSNTSLYSVNIHGSVDGMKAGSNTLVQDSYIHDMSWFSSDPNQGGGSTHNDGVQTLNGSHITLRHNNIDMSTTKDGNAAWQVTQDFGTISDLHAENNWLDGGGCTLNVSHKGGAAVNSVYIVNNRFGRHTSFSNCSILISTKMTLAQNTGNVWDDTGAAIPAPQRHD